MSDSETQLRGHDPVTPQSKKFDGWQGLSIRDLIAIEAMKSLIPIFDNKYPISIADAAYDLADAMLSCRQVNEEPMANVLHTEVYKPKPAPEYDPTPKQHEDN